MDWIGRDGLDPDTHEAYLTDFVNHFYKNIVKMIDRGMKKEIIGTTGVNIWHLIRMITN